MVPSPESKSCQRCPPPRLPALPITVTVTYHITFPALRARWILIVGYVVFLLLGIRHRLETTASIRPRLRLVYDGNDRFVILKQQLRPAVSVCSRKRQSCIPTPLSVEG
jgi:hypothetical protein